MQRHERERSTRHPVRSILALTMPEVLDLVENSDQPTRRREWQMKQFKSTRPGSAFPRSPRSDQQPFPSPSRSRHCRRIQSCQDANIPGAGGNWRQHCHYDINRRRCLPSRGNQADHGRTSCRCPIASSCTPLSCTPLSTKMPAAISVTASGAVFGVTRRTLRCVAVPLREPPTGCRPSNRINMGCLAGFAGLRKRRDYLISAQAYALISSPTAISMMTGVFHFIAVFLDLILAGGKSRVAAKRRRIRQTR